MGSGRENSKPAMWLTVGDVIIAPDGSRHTVTHWESDADLATGLVTFDTDTGLKLNKFGIDRWHEYDIEPRSPSSEIDRGGLDR